MKQRYTILTKKCIDEFLKTEFGSDCGPRYVGILKDKRTGLFKKYYIDFTNDERISAFDIFKKAGKAVMMFKGEL